MSYLKAGGVERLQLPSDPQYWVEMKLRASYGDKLAAQQSMFSSVDLAAAAAANGGGMPTALETAGYFRCILARLITKWNLTDHEDQPLPITEETIGWLEDEDGEFLQQAARSRLAGRPKAAELPFVKASSQLLRATELEAPKRRRR